MLRNIIRGRAVARIPGFLYSVSSAGLVFAVAGTLAAEPPADYDQRLRQMEQRMDRVEGRGAKSDGSSAGTGRIGSNAFNPAVSLILDGRYASFSRDPATYALPGFTLPAETGPGDEGLSLGESELVFSANIDDKFYGQFTGALTPENEFEIEEAFVETLALGNGFTARAGRFFSGIGYLNPVHAHAWDFTDQPLPYRALLGNQYGDDGLQLRWIAPTDLLIELGAEMFRGDSFPAGGAARQGKGTRTGFARIGGDIGASHAWRAGVSTLRADAKDRESGDETSPDILTGKSKITAADFVWKWAPNRNAKVTNFKFQTEYFKRDEDGTFDAASAGTPLDYSGAQRGWYAQAVYQFMPRWRLGLRTDRVKADDVDAAFAGTAVDNQGHEPKRMSTMVDFSNSEFARFRLQYTRDESRVAVEDNQWYLQYTMSLGAHGAHQF